MFRCQLLGWDGVDGMPQDPLIQQDNVEIGGNLAVLLLGFENPFFATDVDYFRWVFVIFGWCKVLRLSMASGQVMMAYSLTL